jgi:hypothetical protein
MPLLCLSYHDGSSTNFPLVGFDKGKLTLKLGFTEPGVHELNFYCHDFDSGKIISVKDVSVFITEDDIEIITSNIDLNKCDDYYENNFYDCHYKNNNQECYY